MSGNVSLSSLEGSPNTVGDYRCNHSPNIKTVKGMSPNIRNTVDFYKCGLITLLYATKYINDYTDNPCFQAYNDLDYNIKNWQDLALHAKALSMMPDSYEDDIVALLYDIKKTDVALYEGLISHEPKLGAITGARGKELLDTYNKVKGIEGGYF